MAQFRKIEFFVPAETLEGLRRIAAEAGVSLQEICAQLLCDIVEDDAAAHSEGKEAA